MTPAPAAPGRNLGGAVAPALAAALLLTACFAPRFGIWRGLGIPDLQIFPEINRAADALRQLQDPFAPITNPSNRAIGWRLLFPLLGHALHLPAPIFLTLPFLGCLAALTYAAVLLRRCGWRDDEVLAGLLIVGGAPWFFVSSGWLAYFDAWVVLALLLCAGSPSPRVVGVACFLAPWIDERFLFLLPVSLLLRSSAPTSGSGLAPTSVTRPWTIAALAIAPYLLARFGALWFGTGRDAEYLRELAGETRTTLPWSGYAWGLWEGLRLAWLPVGWFCLRGPGSRRHRGALAATTGIALAVLFGLAADFSRSAGMLVPLALTALAGAGSSDFPRRRRWLWILAAGTLLLPAAHVVNDSRVVIRGLPHEIAAWRHPPGFLRPDPYNLRATELLLAGQPAAALVPLAHALQLDRTFTPALINRATACVRLGRWAEARAAAEEALRREPGLARAWFARAQARRGAGDQAGAASDARKALELAAPGEPLRVQIAEFLVETGARL